jgi:hypothetical protein
MQNSRHVLYASHPHMCVSSTLSKEIKRRWVKNNYFDIFNSSLIYNVLVLEIILFVVGVFC